MLSSDEKSKRQPHSKKRTHHTAASLNKAYESSGASEKQPPSVSNHAVRHKKRKGTAVNVESTEAMTQPPVLIFSKKKKGGIRQKRQTSRPLSAVLHFNQPKPPVSSEQKRKKQMISKETHHDFFSDTTSDDLYGVSPSPTSLTITPPLSPELPSTQPLSLDSAPSTNLNSFFTKSKNLRHILSSPAPIQPKNKKNKKLVGSRSFPQ